MTASFTLISLKSNLYTFLKRDQSCHVSKEVGDWGQKMAIFANFPYYLC